MAPITEHLSPIVLALAWGIRSASDNLYRVSHLGGDLASRCQHSTIGLNHNIAVEFCDEIELLLANCAQYSTPNLVSFAYDFYDIRAASWHTPHLKLHYDGLHHAVELQVVLADLREGFSVYCNYLRHLTVG